MRRLARIALLLAPLCAACSDDGQSTTAPSTDTTITTDAFASLLPVGGVNRQLFTVEKAGTYTVKLVSAGPPSDVVVGFGVGIPTVLPSLRPDLVYRDCFLTTSLGPAAGPTATLSGPIDPGIYCVSIYDDGHLPGTVSFSITIEHP